MYRICALLLVDIFAVGLIVPLITAYLRDLGASARAIGALQSIYGLIQLGSGPAIGAISDHVPRKLVLIVCSFGGAFGYSILTFTSSVWYVLSHT